MLPWFILPAVMPGVGSPLVVFPQWALCDRVVCLLEVFPLWAFCDRVVCLLEVFSLWAFCDGSRLPVGSIFSRLPIRDILWWESFACWKYFHYEHFVMGVVCQLEVFPQWAFCDSRLPVESISTRSFLWQSHLPVGSIFHNELFEKESFTCDCHCEFDVRSLWVVTPRVSLMWRACYL